MTVWAIPPVGPVNPVSGVPGGTGTPRTTPGSGGGFGDALVAAVENLEARSDRVGAQIAAAAAGRDVPVEQLVVDMAETSLAVNLAVTVRDRAVEAFNEIMRMPL